MNIAGIILDLYDDKFGTIIKQAFPTAEDLPEIVKTAHKLNPEERGVLRDEAYALVAEVEGIPLRKFACVDPGNTLLSAIYFDYTHDKLPEEMKKEAASKIANYFFTYGLDRQGYELPESIKTAAQVKESLSAEFMAKAVRSAATTGKGVPAARGQKLLGTLEKRVGRASQTSRQAGMHALENKAHVADAVSSIGQKSPMHVPTMEQGTVRMKKAGVEKTSALVRRRDPNEQAYVGADTDWQQRTNLTSVQGTGDTGKVMTSVGSSNKTASIFALGDRYPIDSYEQVKTAAVYFEDNYLQMDPEDRHEYSVKVSARASELGIPVSSTLSRYGSTNTAYDLSGHINARIDFADDSWKPVYKEILEKTSSMDAQQLAVVLDQADRASMLSMHWDGQLADPFFAVYGPSMQKVSEQSWTWMGRVGDYVTADQLNKLARNGRPLVHKHFDSDITNAFIKDPITIFESLPEAQKILLARMASQEYDGLSTN